MPSPSEDGRAQRADAEDGEKDRARHEVVGKRRDRIALNGSGRISPLGPAMNASPPPTAPTPKKISRAIAVSGEPAQMAAWASLHPRECVQNLELSTKDSRVQRRQAHNQHLDPLLVDLPERCGVCTLLGSKPPQVLARQLRSGNNKCMSSYLSPIWYRRRFRLLPAVLSGTGSGSRLAYS